MNRLQLEQLKAWHERQLDQINHVLPGCQSCRFAAPSCVCEIYHSKPPMDVFLRHGCDQWEHEVGRAAVMWRADEADGNMRFKPSPRVIDPSTIDDDSIPF